MIDTELRALNDTHETTADDLVVIWSTSAGQVLCWLVPGSSARGQRWAHASRGGLLHI